MVQLVIYFFMARKSGGAMTQCHVRDLGPRFEVKNIPDMFRNKRFFLISMLRPQQLH